MLNVAQALRGTMLIVMFLPHAIAGAQAKAVPLPRIQFDAMLAVSVIG